MLTDRFINDLLRDNHTWQRAIRQPDLEECLAPTSRAAKSNMGPVFRRGCNDNVSSLRFVNCLRDFDDKLNVEDRTRFLRQRMKESWNPSTKLTSSYPNMLYNLLLHHLELRGFSSGYEESREVLLKHQEKEVELCQKQREAQKKAETFEESKKKKQNIFEEESRERILIIHQERRKKESIINIMHDQALVIMTNEEFNKRRLIYQASFLEYNMIKKNAEKDLESIIGIPVPFHRPYFAILKHEKEHRKQIYLLFEKQREAAAKQLKRDIRTMLQTEIDRVAAKELILQQIIQISKQARSITAE